MVDFQSHARDTFANQESARQLRDQIAENSARQAFFTAEQQVNGVGFVSMDKPLMFDCIFTEKPAFVSGSSIVTMPDVTHYRYPICDVGIYKWVTEPTPEAKQRYAASLRDSATNAGGGALSTNQVQAQLDALDPASIYAPEDLLWKGAYLYFHIYVPPIRPPRTDGSNLAYLVTQAGAATGAALTTLRALIAEAQESVYLQAHPPRTSVVFSLMWTGIALKGLPGSVLDKMHGDPSIPPAIPGYTLATQP